MKWFLLATCLFFVPVHSVLALAVWGLGFAGADTMWLGVAKLVTTWAVLVCSARLAAKRTVKLGVLAALLQVVGLVLWWQCEAHGVFFAVEGWLAADVIGMAAVGLGVPVVLVYSSP